MCKKIVITNRHLVHGDFLTQIERVLKTKPQALILREKDLTDSAYQRLAEQVLLLCKTQGVRCYFNGRLQIARQLSADGVQMPFSAFMDAGMKDLADIPRTGVSVHSREEAEMAASRGADFLIYGHIFETDCKPGLTPRGLSTLESVCSSVTIPVFAIGGIQEKNASLCIEAGAAGICMMSRFMRME